MAEERKFESIWWEIELPEDLVSIEDDEVLMKEGEIFKQGVYGNRYRNLPPKYIYYFVEIYDPDGNPDTLNIDTANDIVSFRDVASNITEIDFKKCVQKKRIETIIETVEIFEENAMRSGHEFNRLFILPETRTSAVFNPYRG